MGQTLESSPMVTSPMITDAGSMYAEAAMTGRLPRYARMSGCRANAIVSEIRRKRYLITGEQHTERRRQSAAKWNSAKIASTRRTDKEAGLSEPNQIQRFSQG